MVARLDPFLPRIFCGGDRTRPQGKRAEDHFQLECCWGHPPRIVLAISYARGPDRVLWWEWLLNASLSCKEKWYSKAQGAVFISD